jgi:hypothetical protein
MNRYGTWHGKVAKNSWWGSCVSVFTQEWLPPRNIREKL